LKNPKNRKILQLENEETTYLKLSGTTLSVLTVIMLFIVLNDKTKVIQLNYLHY
jgi:hypothetical protein